MRYGQGVASKRIMFVRLPSDLPADKQRRALLELCGSYEDLRASPQPSEVHRLRTLLQTAPLPESFREAVCAIDVEYVTSAWMKIVERLRPPKGAITAARTLVETVYMHVLCELGIEFDSKGDLGRLHKRTIQALGIPEMSKSETLLKIVGSFQESLTESLRFATSLVMPTAASTLGRSNRWRTYVSTQQVLLRPSLSELLRDRGPRSH